MDLTRRTALAAGAALTISAALPAPARAQAPAPATRRIPSSGEAIPAVGLGTWITFNVGDDPVLRDECADVMAAFFEAGGRVIDSSPMYGSSQAVIGYGLEKLGRPPGCSRRTRSGPRPTDGRRRSSSRGATGACRASTCCRCTIWSPGKSI